MTDYDLLARQLEALISDTEWEISLLANASALIWDALDNINWAGFYLMRNGMLELGPFQGKVACVTIGPGKGVCGASVSEDRTLLVPDVHRFPGHIACDSASNSEIVIPLHAAGKIYGVLDIDSPLFSRFDEADKCGLETLAEVIEKRLEEILQAQA